MESNDIKLVVYLIFAILFGPYLAVHFAFIGDYYSLSKTYVSLVQSLFFFFFLKKVKYKIMFLAHI